MDYKGFVTYKTKPFEQIETAVIRMSSRGDTDMSFIPEERINLLTAIAAFTNNTACIHTIADIPRALLEFLENPALFDGPLPIYTTVTQPTASEISLYGRLRPHRKRCYSAVNAAIQGQASQ